jgi:hypothetical protein
VLGTRARGKLFELADVASKARGKTASVISPIVHSIIAATAQLLEDPDQRQLFPNRLDSTACLRGRTD